MVRIIHTVPTATTTRMYDNQSSCLTSSPVTFNRERSRNVLHDVSGVKMYEDMDDIGEAFEDSSDNSYEIVTVGYRKSNFWNIKV